MLFKKKNKKCDFKYKIYWNDGSISEGEITDSKYPPSAIFLENRFIYFLAGKGACFNRDEIKQIEIFDLIEKEENNMFKKNKNKEKQIKKSEIIAVSADKAIIRNSTFDKETEVSKKIILICYHLVDYLAYVCLVLGVIIFFLIPIVGMFIIILSKLLFDVSKEYNKILKNMKAFKSGNENRDL